MAYHVVVLLGTRPEAVKLAPLVIALRARRGLCCTLVSSGQHRDLVGPALEEFSLKPDLDLDIMQASQSLAGLSSRILKRVDQALVRLQPDWLLVQGDTTTAAVGGLCAFYRGIPVGHVEAGLRSHRFDAPFPEEFNRRLLSLMARLHFAPTAAAADNLHREGVEPERVRVTGNTGIDALLQRIRALRLRPEPLPAEIAAFLACYGRLVLVTSHRRENLGAGLRNICEAVAHLADRYQDVGFLYPLHPNPQIASTASQVIRCRPNVLLA